MIVLPLHRDWFLSKRGGGGLDWEGIALNLKSVFPLQNADRLNLWNNMYMEIFIITKLLKMTGTKITTDYKLYILILISREDKWRER